MLLAIRNKATGWVAWLIVAIIAVPFALFGINSYFDGANQISVASVNGEDIPVETFQREMDQRRRSFQQQFGDNFNPAMIDNAAFRTQVVESLVSGRLIRQYVQDKNLRIGDEALRERITTASYFQEEGKFSSEAYRRLISSNGYTTEGFEQQERLNGALEQLSDGISSSAFTSKAEENRLLALNLQERTADYVVISAQPFTDAAVITADSIQAEYDRNQDSYQQAARVKLDFVELLVSDLADKAELDDDEIAAAYESSKAQYTQPEARKASHILFTIPKSADEAEQAEIKAKAETVLAEAQAGADFADLSKEHSEDPGSRRNGGDLGLVTKGQMVAPFEEAVFDMKAGEIRGPIKTQFGFHIIKLTELSEERIKTLEEARSQVEKAEKKRLAETQFFDLGETLRTLAFENPDSLELAANELGLKVKTTDWFEQSGAFSSIGASSANPAFSNAIVRNAAFSAEVLQDKLNSEAIEVGDDRLIVVRRNDYEAAHVKPLEDVQEQIESDLKNSQGADKAEEAGKAVVVKIKAGEPLEQAVEDSRRTLPNKRSLSVDPDQRAIATMVFTAPKPDGADVVDGLRLVNGDYVVYSLSDVQLGDPKSAEQADRSRIQQQLTQRDGAQYFSAFQRQLRTQAKVAIISGAIEDDDYQDTTPHPSQM